MDTSSSGFVAIPKFILQNPDLTPESIILYANLLHFDRGKDSKGCYARRSTISKFSNLSLHKVRNGIKVLEEHGIITVIRRRNSLTDIIKITPDCRPPIKEVPIRAPKSRKPAQHTKPLSKSRNTYEIKEFNTYLIEKNKTVQTNDICSTRTTEVVTNTHKPHKNTSFAEQGTTIEPQPNKLHQHATEVLLSQLKPLIRQKSFEVWFSNCWIENQTEHSVHFRSGKGIYVADWIKQNYIGQLKRLTGKQVTVTA